MLYDLDPTWVQTLVENSPVNSPSFGTPPNDGQLLDAYSKTVSSAAAAVSPAVVNIQVKGSPAGRRGEGGGSRAVGVARTLASAVALVPLIL